MDNNFTSKKWASHNAESALYNALLSFEFGQNCAFHNAESALYNALLSYEFGQNCAFHNAESALYNALCHMNLDKVVHFIMYKVLYIMHKCM